MGDSRIVWVDYAKAVAIILIVASHIQHGVFKMGLFADSEAYQFVDAMLYSFHVPLFFFLSGLFFSSSFSKRGFKSFLSVKLRTILYPFALWTIIQTGIEVVLGAYTGNPVPASDILVGLIIPRAHFWFLYALFFMSAITALIWCWNRRRAAWIALLLAVFLVSTYKFIDYGPFNDLAKNYLYFALGIIGAQRFDLLSRFARIPRCSTLLTFGLFCALQVWFFLLDFSGTVAGRIVLAASGIGFVASLCAMMNGVDLPWLKYIGGKTLPVYVAHVLAAYPILLVLQKLTPLSNPLIYAFLGMVFGIGLPLLLDHLARKFGMEFLFEYPRN